MNEGDYFLIRLGEDGPTRLEGNKTYEKFDHAEAAVGSYFAKNPTSAARIAVVQIKGVFALEREPRIIREEIVREG